MKFYLPVFRIFLILLLSALAFSPYTETIEAQTVVHENPLCPYYGGDLRLPAIITPGDYDGITSGYLTAFFPDPLTHVYGLHVYGVPRDTPITTNYYIEYIGGTTEPVDADIPVRFYALLNERFLALGESGELYRDVILPHQETFDLPIMIEPLEDGIHDLVIVAVPTPNVPVQNPLGVDILNSLLRRITLVVGEVPEEIVDSRQYVEMTEVSNGTDFKPDDIAGYPTLNITRNNSDVPWNFPESELLLPASSPYQFNIRLGRTRYFADYSYTDTAEYDRIPYALILFEDYEPVSIIPDSGENVFYGVIVGDDALVQHDVTLNAPESGTRDLVAVRIDHPGKPICHIISGVSWGIYGMRVVVGTEE